MSDTPIGDECQRFAGQLMVYRDAVGMHDHTWVRLSDMAVRGAAQRAARRDWWWRNKRVIAELAPALFVLAAIALLLAAGGYFR